jgi:hypothetical protein
MFTPQQIRMLKVAVIGMGVILLLGFALVIGRIIYLVNAPPRTDAAGAAVAPSAIALPAGASVRHIAVSGNRLVVHFEGPAGAGIRIVDLAGATPAVTLPITVEPPARKQP